MFSGNPTKYCDYILTTIDKDKNGKISFYEFMSVVALTSTGNDDIEKRLSLVSVKDI
jgi:Ca2+-binding EF-hand superfamily protein